MPRGRQRKLPAGEDFKNHQHTVMVDRGSRTSSEKLAALRALPSDHPIKVKNRERARQWRLEHPGYSGKQEAAKMSWLKANDPEEYTRRKSKYAASARTRGLKKYGLTEESWNALFEAQGRCCAICGTDDSCGRWHTDHDPDKGFTAVRGILCVRCNIGIGQFLHDPRILCEAVIYLQEQP